MEGWKARATLIGAAFFDPYYCARSEVGIPVANLRKQRDAAFSLGLRPKSKLSTRLPVRKAARRRFYFFWGSSLHFGLIDVKGVQDPVNHRSEQGHHEAQEYQPTKECIEGREELGTRVIQRSYRPHAGQDHGCI